MCHRKAFQEQHNMQLRQFGIESVKARREAEQIRTVIVDLDCTVQLIDCEIAAEELRARVFKPTNIAYPVLAKSLAARRDNLYGTIAALEKQLAATQVALSKATATAA
jgi:hypothetical protein